MSKVRGKRLTLKGFNIQIEIGKERYSDFVPLSSLSSSKDAAKQIRDRFKNDPMRKVVRISPRYERG